MTPPGVSVVLPSFNVEMHLRATVRALREEFQRRSDTWEAVIVDDGSTDGTRHAAQELLDEYPGTLLWNDRNKGKGHAVRRGVLAAVGNVILVVDADLTYPPHQLHTFLDAVQGPWDIAIGNRRDQRSRYHLHPTAFRYLYIRHLIGISFNWAARHVAGLSYLDTQCGFKAFRRAAAHDIFQRVTLPGYLYDVEALRLADLLGYRVTSLPVTYLYRGQPTSVRPLLGAVPVLLDLLRARFRHTRRSVR
jgi:glycosyltransferase involved in cell wall biosynthesis